MCGKRLGWGRQSANTRAACEILPDRSVTMRIGTQDIGTGTRTLVGMITAETMGLPLESVTVAIGDTNHPFAPGSGGGITVGSSLQPSEWPRKPHATRSSPVAPALGAEPCSRSKGRAHRREDCGRKVARVRDACKLLGTEPVNAPGQWEKGLSDVGTSGVQFADVEVDIETGVTRVGRIVCVQDAGMIVDRLTAESQCIGGIIMGLGFALYEHRILDRNTAQMVNPNMEFYLLPGMSDIPTIDVTLVDRPDRGVVGLGEPPDFYRSRGGQRGGERHRRAREKAPADARRPCSRRSNRSAQEGRCETLRVKAAGEKQAVAALAAPGGKPFRLPAGWISSA